VPRLRITEVKHAKLFLRHRKLETAVMRLQDVSHNLHFIGANDVSAVPSSCDVSNFQLTEVAQGDRLSTEGGVGECRRSHAYCSISTITSLFPSLEDKQQEGFRFVQ